MLPDFVVIGGMKCGTTSLWHYLRMHPEIFVPPSTKNLEFFINEDNWAKGVNWYESHFRFDDPNIKAVGEISTEYTKFPKFAGVPENMSSVLSGAKLIYLVRDPIDRIVSQYIHLVGAATENRDIQSALADLSHNPYVFISKYYFQLEQFLRFFPKERILIVVSEDLRSNRNETLKTIFDYIGVSSEFVPPKEIRVNTREEKKQWNPMGKIIRRSPKHFDRFNYYKSKLPNAGRRFLEAMVNRAIVDCKLSQSTRDRLSAELRPDVEKLRDFSGRSFAQWKL